MKSLTLSRGAVMLGALMLWHAPDALAAGSGENTPLNLSTTTSGTHVSSGGSSIVRTIVGLFIVIAVIYGIAWILRQAKRGGSSRARGKSLHQLATLPLGSGRSVALVRAGNELILVGIAEQGVTPLRRYTEAEAIEAGFDLSEDQSGFDREDGESRGFLDALRRMTVRS